MRSSKHSWIRLMSAQKANEALQEAATRQAVQAEMNPLATVGWLRQDMAAP